MNYSGTSARVNGFWSRLKFTPSDTWGEVVRQETSIVGTEGDVWNPRRQVTFDVVVATTRPFPAYHTDGVDVAVRALLAKIAGVSVESLTPEPRKPIRAQRRKRVLI
jgi:hypothetical protein